MDLKLCTVRWATGPKPSSQGWEGVVLPQLTLRNAPVGGYNPLIPYRTINPVPGDQPSRFPKDGVGSPTPGVCHTPVWGGATQHPVQSLPWVVAQVMAANA